MNRVIKFRAWDGKHMILPKEKQYYQHYVAFSGDIIQSSREGMACFDCVDSWTIHTGKIELMQFTGLLDKNGKEIYEGDIVCGRYEFQDRWCDLIEEVKFFDCYFAPFGAWLGDGSGMLYSTSIDNENFEVIGNIYENGDLLK